MSPALLFYLLGSTTTAAERTYPTTFRVAVVSLELEPDRTRVVGVAETPVEPVRTKVVDL